VWQKQLAARKICQAWSKIEAKELGRRHREMGYEIDADPKRGLFEIEGIPEKLIQRISQRAEQNNQHAAEHGRTGQAARVRSFYQTSGPKEKIGLDDLHAQWLERAGKEIALVAHVRQSAGYGERAVFAVEPAIASRAALFGLRHSESGEAVNNQGHIIRSGLASPLILARFNRRPGAFDRPVCPSPF
jgi:hypothetical protein